MTTTLCIPGTEAQLLGVPSDPQPRLPLGNGVDPVRITRIIVEGLLPKECTFFTNLHDAADEAGLVTDVPRTPDDSPIDFPTGAVAASIDRNLKGACGTNASCCEQLVPAGWIRAYEAFIGSPFASARV